MSRRCFKCNETGHLKENCLQIICRKCKKAGHYKSECPYSDENYEKKYKKASASKPTQRKGEIDFFFLLDVSGSMSGYRLEEAKKVLLDITQNQLQKHDRFALITFDSGAYWKMHPHPMKKVENEILSLVRKIHAGKLTAFYDAVHMAYSEIRNKENNTVVVVLTDGEDNSSKKTYQDCLDLADKYDNVSLNIIQIKDVPTPIEAYQNLCKGRGDFIMIEQDEIETVGKKFIIEIIVKIRELE